ncbi:MAG: pimeloyl-ACP methyl ester carboxylesterase [Hyphomicrobiaceae bacterium]|jgi:pimeloyl-ACP methyl ester carboxylesterase
MSIHAQNDLNSTPHRVQFQGHDNVGLVGDAFGDPARPPVLLLHGGGQTRHAWGATAQALAVAGFYAIALDLRGHGDSDWHEHGDYHVARFAEDIALVSQTLAAPPALVGASLGGLSALLCEGEVAKGIASAVVLVDVTPKMEPAGVDRIIAFMSAYPDGFANLDEAADAVAEYLPHRPRPSDSSGLAKNLRRKDNGRLRWHWDPRFIGDKPRTHDPDFGERMRAAARAIAVPTLLVRGQMSEIVSEEGVREFLELVPHAEYVDVKDAAHMVAGDRNDAFRGAVVEFLARALESDPA